MTVEIMKIVSLVFIVFFSISVVSGRNLINDNPPPAPMNETFPMPVEEVQFEEFIKLDPEIPCEHTKKHSNWFKVLFRF